MSRGIAELVEAMRLGTSMDSPAGMAALLTEGAALIEELVSSEQMTLEDLFAQSALDRCMKWADELHDASPGEVFEAAADFAYSMAEAMIKRRKQ